MRKRPRYSLVQNAKYALCGLKECFANEISFKIEVAFFLGLSLMLWLLPIHLLSKVLLQSSLFIPLIAELFNSAIERTVDLCTKEHNILAKYAKDSAAAAVLLSLFLTLGIWIAVGIYEFL